MGGVFLVVRGREAAGLGRCGRSQGGRLRVLEFVLNHLALDGRSVPADEKEGMAPGGRHAG